MNTYSNFESIHYINEHSPSLQIFKREMLEHRYSFPHSTVLENISDSPSLKHLIPYCADP